jgi:hypothetical protein
LHPSLSFKLGKEVAGIMSKSSWIILLTSFRLLLSWNRTWKLDCAGCLRFPPDCGFIKFILLLPSRIDFASMEAKM